MMKQSDLLAGLSREQYIRQQVTLEGFPALEDDWRELLQWVTKISGNLWFYNLQLEKSGNWGEFWRNQLLVILTDVALLDTEGCRRQFIAAKGTGKEREALEKLECFVKDMVARLKRCEYNLVLNCRQGKGEGGVLEEITSELLVRLGDVTDREREQESLMVTEETTVNSLFFFRMLDAICELRTRYACYMDRIVSCGEIDPALVVLYVFLKNYTCRTAVFNQRLSCLPVFYIQEILKSRPRGALPDHAWIAVNKTAEMGPVIVPAGMAFTGGVNEDGSDLHYLSGEEIVVTDMQLDGIYSVLLKQEGKISFSSAESVNQVIAVCRRRIPLLAGEEAAELFGGGEAEEVPVGWMIESPMFDLREGRREVELRLALTSGSAGFLAGFEDQIRGEDAVWIPEQVFGDAFVIKVSGGEGWLEAESCVTLLDKVRGVLVIRFVLSEGMAVVQTCAEEVHGVATRWPAIQLVLNGKACVFAYSWACRVAFEQLTVKVKVSGVTDLKIYSEYGELDASIPFYPFGVQAKKGACFVFGNYEMACKPLTKVVLSYRWQQLPTGEEGFKGHYAFYEVKPAIDNRSFEVRAEWLKDRKWVSQVVPLCLFQSDRVTGRVEENGFIAFRMDREMPVVDVPEENYAAGKVRHGFLRVVLSAPEIGFGSEQYRQLFTRIMINNSRKGKEPDALPAEPVTPMMSDVELAYEAEDTFAVGGTGVRFYQLKPLAWKPFVAVEEQPELLLAESLEDVAGLLFAFRHARGIGRVRVYFDMTMRKDETGFSDVAGDEMRVSWSYNDGHCWQVLPSEQVLQENTHVFTHAGLVELVLPVPVAEDWLDGEGRFWLCASVRGDYRECRLVRGFYVNAVEVVADGGSGRSLPGGTITQSAVPIPGIESVSQIVSGFGGCPPEDERCLSLRIAHRIAHRGRAVNPVDFERMALEQFPVLEKVRCIPVTESGQQVADGSPLFVPKVRLVVMSREQGGKYPLCSLVTLQDIRKRLSVGISPFVAFEVANPVYEKIRIHCRVKLVSPACAGAVLRKLQGKISYYIAPWLSRNEMPELNRGLSLQGLYTVLVNEAEVAGVESLRAERVDEDDPERRWAELKFLPEASVLEEDVVVKEGVCGGVFIPDEGQGVEWGE